MSSYHIIISSDHIIQPARLQSPRLHVLEPEPGKAKKLKIQHGLAIMLGDTTIRCRQQVREKKGISDDYWAEAAGGKRFRVTTDSFTGDLPQKIGLFTRVG